MHNKFIKEKNEHEHNLEPKKRRKILIGTHFFKKLYRKTLQDENDRIGFDFGAKTVNKTILQEKIRRKINGVARRTRDLSPQRERLVLRSGQVCFFYF